MGGPRKALPAREARPHVVAGLLVVLALLAAGCSRPSKHEILEKTRDVHTRGELEEVLGSPDDREVLAMFEQWTYRAADGVVVFHVAHDKIIFRTTHKDQNEKKSAGDGELE